MKHFKTEDSANNNLCDPHTAEKTLKLWQIISNKQCKYTEEYWIV